MFECADGSIYLDGKLLGTFPRLRETWINDAGNYFFLSEETAGIMTAHINGLTNSFEIGDLLPYSGYRGFPPNPGYILLDKNYQHFLLYSPAANFFIIDGKKYASMPGKTKFYYLKQSNSFCWLTIEGRRIYWHSVQLG